MPTPELDLGAPSANHSLEARLGNDRWVLAESGQSGHPGVALMAPGTLLDVFTLTKALL
ncbi:MAG: hypothetical protein LC808_11050 [Actinobacteria bacterium]|nr:hypothetical protein [Actinomycetota bacterium]